MMMLMWSVDLCSSLLVQASNIDVYVIYIELSHGAVLLLLRLFEQRLAVACVPFRLIYFSFSLCVCVLPFPLSSYNVAGENPFYRIYLDMIPYHYLLKKLMGHFCPLVYVIAALRLSSRM
jgi:hypothetical protein